VARKVITEDTHPEITSGAPSFTIILAGKTAVVTFFYHSHTLARSGGTTINYWTTTEVSSL
jgi:hypothetical protein